MINGESNEPKDSRIDVGTEGAAGGAGTDPGGPAAASQGGRSHARRLAAELVGRMTPEEKISQMRYDAAGIERLGIPEYNWWNECMHGVSRAGIATVFPQSIAVAATFDTALMHRMAEVIATEGRAKHHEFVRRGDRGIYKGLTFWSPNINIFRDPRWGRGHETYGEDPYLSARMGVAFVTGLQGHDPWYLKAVATPKHFAVHSGPEIKRHEFNAQVNAKDLFETYLPAFEACVVEGGAAAVMGAYNRVNGEAACASTTLLNEILRKQWGFTGHVVSDCGAIHDIHEYHNLTTSAPESAALAVKAGCDLNCGMVYPALTEALDRGLIDEATLDVAVGRLLEARIRLGIIDVDGIDPDWGRIPYDRIVAPEHRELARQVARESIVLLKNERVLQGRLVTGSAALPLPPDLKRVAVVGPNADERVALLGNYYGTPSSHVTPLRGIRDRLEPSTTVFYSEGCDHVRTETSMWGDGPDIHFTEAVAFAERSDVVVLCLGLTALLEGEEGDAANSDGGGDRVHLGLPGVQEQLLERLLETETPVIIVLLNGGPITLPAVAERAAAILELWYPGEGGGNALADVLFGDYNPAGRLPVTVVRDMADLPPFEDYQMADRTYRYSGAEPQYPFGYGLSYTNFQYAHAKVEPEELSIPGDTAADLDAVACTVIVVVTNTGNRAGDEVVQVYRSSTNAHVRVPIRELQGFMRVSLAVAESRSVSIPLTWRALSYVDDEGARVLAPGEIALSVGGHQGDPKSTALTGRRNLEAKVTLRGAHLRRR